jgi:hypothetical protein
MPTATDPLISRSDYIAGAASHRAYYAQFVTPAHFARLVSIADRIKESTDPHFSDIPIAVWDALAVPVPAETAATMRQCGDYPTLAGAVCTLKEAARQMRDSK